jgi:hypothetical protein
LSQDGEMTSKRAVRLAYAPDGGSRSQLRLQSPQLSPARLGGFAPGETTADPRPTALDPKLPFKIGPVNEREARESGLSLKASVALGMVVQRCDAELVNPIRSNDRRAA